MIRKETLDFIRECVRIFDAGKPASKSVLDGVQFVDRNGSDVSNVFLFSTGAIKIAHSGVPKASIPEGFAQYRVPVFNSNWKVDNAGNVTNDETALYPAPQAPQLSLKSTATMLNTPTAPAMPVRMLNNFVSAKYVYMEDRDIFCIPSDETKSSWVSSAADIPKSLVTPSIMTKEFVKLFSEKAEDTLVSFIGVNSQYVAMQLYSEKLHVRVTHILATPAEQTINVKFGIGKTNLVLTRQNQDFKLTKEENMDISQVSQLFGATAPVTVQNNEPVVAVAKEEPKTEAAESVAENKEPQVSAVTEEKVIPEGAAEVVAETPTPSQQEPAVEVPLSEAVLAVIEMLDERKQKDAIITKSCKEIHKRLKKLEKNPPKTDTDKIADLEAKISKLTRMLNAAME